MIPSRLIALGQEIGTRIALVCLLWACCYGIHPGSAVPFNGLVFAFILLFVLAYLAGQLCQVLKLPPLIGMLLVGIALTNSTSIHFDESVSSFARNFALGIILLRAGVSLDPMALQKLSMVCLRLAFTPCMVETLTLALGTYLLLGLPFIWCMTLGFVCVATSPAVIVPAMIVLQEAGLGTAKGIPTLIIGGSSIDDVMAITGFEIFLGLVFSQSSSIMSTLAGPAEAVGGLIIGTAIGFLFWWLPPRGDPSSRDDIVSGAKIRFALVFLTGIGFIFATKALGAESMGPLGCLATAFVGALRWRSEGYIEVIGQTLKDIWFFAEIFLFSLIGIEVQFSRLKANTVLWCLVCLMVGMVTRSIASFGIIFGAGFTVKERLFVAMAWLPKGTVQAAIGSIALELARARQDAEAIEYGLVILTYAVLSIIISAPLGAALIRFFGPKLLKDDQTVENIETVDGNSKNIPIHA